MKKLFFAVALLFFAGSVFSQSKIKRKIVEAKQKLILNGYDVTEVTDSILTESSVKLVTENSIVDFVEGQRSAKKFNGLPGGVIDSILVYQDTSVLPNRMYFWDGSGFAEIGSGGGVNIYSNDGVLSEGRKVDLGGFGLRFESGKTTFMSAHDNDPILGLRHGNYGPILRLGRNGVDSLASIDYPTTGAIGLTTVGVERMRILSNGSVGIGTLTPQRKLDVKGRIRFSSNAAQDINGYAEIYTSFAYQKGETYIAPEGTTAPLRIFPNGALVVGSNISNLPPTNGLIVDGNVGIGEDIPAAKFHLVGNGSGTGKSFFVENNVGDDNFVILDNGKVGIGTTTPDNELTVEGILQFNSANSSGDDGKFALYSWSDYMQLTPRNDNGGYAGFAGLVLDSLGRLGIGINPSQELDVMGDMRLRGRIFDENNHVGTSGQILSTTATGTDWIDPPSGGVSDNIYTADGTLAGARTITSTGQSLTYSAIDGNDINVTSFNDNSVVIGLTDTGTGAVGSYNFTPEQMKVSSGAVRIINDVSDQLLIGDNETNSTTKNATVSGIHYTNAEEPITFLYSQASSGANSLRFGGGTSSGNCVTIMDFHTASNTTTVTGTRRMRIDGDGLVSIGLFNSPFAQLNIKGIGTTSATTVFETDDSSNNTTFKITDDGTVHIFSDMVINAANNVRIVSGLNSPEGSVTAGIGSTYHRTNGGSGTSFYVKESGTGNTGWIAK